MSKLLPQTVYQWVIRYWVIKPVTLLLNNRNEFPWFIESYLGLQKLRIFSLSSYTALQVSATTKVASWMRTLTFLGPKFARSGGVHRDDVPTKGEFAQELQLLLFRDVQVRGGSDVVIDSEKRLIFELLDFDKESRFDYRSNGIVTINSHGECVFLGRPAFSSIEKGIKLSQHFSFNYYHFLIEVLARFHYINKSNISSDIPLLVDEVCQTIPQFMELISLLNTDRREIIFLKKKQQYSVKELYYVAEVNIIPPDYKAHAEIKASDVLYDRESLQYIRGKLLPLKDPKEYPRRIFISRKNASARRGYNESEIWPILKKYGFEMVFPENYSIIEQVALFNGAEWIAGTTGAAFTNILYCKEGCNVLCFTNIEMPFSVFSGLANCIGVEILYFADPHCKYTSTHSLHQDFRVDVQTLDAYLRNVIHN